MKRTYPAPLQFLFIVLLSFFVSMNVMADDDDDDDDDEDYTFTPADVNQLARDEVSVRLEPLGFGLMGDSIDPYTGTLVFNQTDVSLPGNSNLEVAIRRIASTAQMTNMQEMFFGDWILDVPNISTLVGTDNYSVGQSNWQTDYQESSIGPYWRRTNNGWRGVSHKRCALGSNVGDIGVSYGGGQNEDIPPEAYTDGINLNIPGKGREQLLNVVDATIYSEFEASNEDIRYVTKDHWVISCLDSVITSNNYVYPQGANDGEGFLAISPNGTRYKMNRLVYMEADPYDADDAPRQLAKIYATEVTDVHGNWVKYDFSDEGKLMRIYSNDGREITLTYYPDSYKIYQVMANGRTWTYTYRDIDEEIGGKMVGSSLYRVIQPDEKYWEYSLDFLLQKPTSGFCTNSNVTTNYVKHPYGVKATYQLGTVRHIQVYSNFWQTNLSTPRTCPHSGEQYSRTGLRYNQSVAVISKTLSGPSVPTSTWAYNYSEVLADRYGKPLDWSTYKTTELTDPVGRKKVSHFYPRTFRDGGGGYGTDTQKALAGKLKKEQSFNQSGDLLEEEEFEYVVSNKLGSVAGDGIIGYRNQEYPSYKDKTVSNRDGDTFTREYTYNTNLNSSAYSFGQPLTIKTHSNVSTTPRETVNTYAYRKDYWVLNLPESVTVNGREMTRNGYDDVGKQLWVEQYGYRVAAFTYQDNASYYGALETFTDAEGRVTTYQDYFRGIFRTIKRNDGSTDYVNVDDNGWVVGQTDYRGFTTGYERDNMGRVTKIIPSKTQKQWFDTDITYDFGDYVTQTITRNSKLETVIYDNFLRTVQEKQTSITNNRSIYSGSTYNEAGEMIFQSFPQTELPLVDGTEFSYDGLGRRKTVTENVAPFVTSSYDYLDSHRTEITDPLGVKTTRYKNGFGELTRIIQAGVVDTQLQRNEWGQLVQLLQQGTQNGYTSNQSQYSYYDDRQRLCRHRTPEGGDSLYQYDTSGRMIAYSKGNNSGTDCAAPSGINKVSMSLDTLGRVDAMDYDDPATADIQTTYDANGNVKNLNRGGMNWRYVYDEGNRLLRETLAVDGREYINSYLYTRNGYMYRHGLPSGNYVHYTLDGLGRTTTVRHGSSPTYGVNELITSQITHHSNGLIQGMQYGNGQAYSQTLTQRQQPLHAKSIKGAELALDYTYTYDKRSSITSIDDQTASNFDQAFTYDALDRLETATGPWGNGAFKYDALGNLREKTLGARDVTVEFDSNNRAIRSTDTDNGNRDISYDNRGNVTGLGNLSFIYDNAQQPISISGKANGTYQYDGNFKRVKSVVDGKTIYNIYDAAGQLTHVDAVTDGNATDYIRLNGQSIARIKNDVITYLHTDHLGSPLAGTDDQGNVLWREKYTPFGEKLIDDVSNRDQASYTGHIDDSATGLTYMQARYYDPTIGRFLSIDPVGFRSSKPELFNRYSYVSNNPNKYIDPFGLDGTDDPKNKDDKKNKPDEDKPDDSSQSMKDFEQNLQKTQKAAEAAGKAVSKIVGDAAEQASKTIPEMANNTVEGVMKIRDTMTETRAEVQTRMNIEQAALTKSETEMIKANTKKREAIAAEIESGNKILEAEARRRELVESLSN